MNDPKPFLILRHIEDNHLSHMGPVLERHGFSAVYRHTNDLEKTGWPDPAEYDGLVILGGYEHIPEIADIPRIHHETQFIRGMIERKKPVFGICLGAQLIAASLGKPVRKNPVCERGWYALSLTDEGRKDPVTGPLGDSFLQFHWHEDTYDLPEGAVQLAQSETCPQQAFRYGNHVYAVQYHPEIDESTIRNWIREAKTLKPEETTAMLDGIKNHLADGQAANRAMFDRFLQKTLELDT